MNDNRLFECQACGQSAQGYHAAMSIRCCDDKDIAQVELVKNADSAEEYPIRGGVLYKSAAGNYSVHIKSGERLPGLKWVHWEQCGEDGHCGHLNADARSSFWDVPEHLEGASIETLAAWIDAR